MRTAERLVGVLLIVSALALTGCDSSNRSASVPPSAPVVTTPAPTPTEMSIEEAGQAYLAMVAAPNAATAAFNDACDRQDARAARAAAGPVAVALRRFGDKVATTAWPATVQPTATQLVAELASDVEFFDRVAAAKTDAAAVAIINGYAPTGNSGPAMRKLLGLPELPSPSPSPSTRDA